MEINSLANEILDLVSERNLDVEAVLVALTTALVGTSIIHKIEKDRLVDLVSNAYNYILKNKDKLILKE